MKTAKLNFLFRALADGPRPSFCVPNMFDSLEVEVLYPT